MFSAIRQNFARQACKSSPRSTAWPQLRFQSTHHHGEQRLIRDKNYPFPLYYHLLPASDTSLPARTTTPAASAALPKYALSFLSTFPQHNRQVVGYLIKPSQNQDSASSPTEIQIKPNKFTENEAFNTVLHSVIQENLAQDPMVDMVLQQQLEGWTHIADYRNPAPYGRIPLPEDIFGSVQIVEGVVQPSSYQRMPSHRIVSSNGLFILSDHLHAKLVQYLQNL